MLKNILIILTLIIVGFVVVVSLRPNEFSYSRSATINAPPSAVFPQVNNLHQWEAWSPWGKLDPNMKMSYEGPAVGTGSIYRWAGNDQVGEGSNTITESQPNELIKMKLEFIKPFKGTNDVQFTFTPKGTQTIVTWSMSGKNNFMSKAVGMFMNCEKMINEQFDKGLAQLKMVVESANTQLVN